MLNSNVLRRPELLAVLTTGVAAQFHYTQSGRHPCGDHAQKSFLYE
jgi:hypothetical protein